MHGNPAGPHVGMAPLPHPGPAPRGAPRRAARTFALGGSSARPGAPRVTAKKPPGSSRPSSRDTLPLPTPSFKGGLATPEGLKGARCRQQTRRKSPSVPAALTSQNIPSLPFMPLPLLGLTHSHRRISSPRGGDSSPWPPRAWPATPRPVTVSQLSPHFGVSSPAHPPSGDLRRPSSSLLAHLALTPALPSLPAVLASALGLTSTQRTYEDSPSAALLTSGQLPNRLAVLSAARAACKRNTALPRMAPQALGDQIPQPVPISPGPLPPDGQSFPNQAWLPHLPPGHRSGL